MGQKVNPHGFRVGPTLGKGWDSILYAENDYQNLFLQDVKIRAFIIKNYALAKISKVLIERLPNKSCVINIYANKPGIIIGRSGNDIEKLKKSIQKISQVEVYINIHEVKKPNIDAPIIAQTITAQLEKKSII